ANALVIELDRVAFFPPDGDGRIQVLKDAAAIGAVEHADRDAGHGPNFMDGRGATHTSHARCAYNIEGKPGSSKQAEAARILLRIGCRKAGGAGKRAIPVVGSGAVGPERAGRGSWSGASTDGRAGSIASIRRRSAAPRQL